MVKAENAYRTITEVAELLQVQASVLRFWETQFAQVKPMKRMGRRYYKAEDVVLLARIRDLLYKEGMTIKGAQKRLKSETNVVDEVVSVVAESDAPAHEAFVQEVADVKEFLGQYV